MLARARRRRNVAVSAGSSLPGDLAHALVITDRDCSSRGTSTSDVGTYTGTPGQYTGGSQRWNSSEGSQPTAGLKAENITGFSYSGDSVLTMVYITGTPVSGAPATITRDVYTGAKVLLSFVEYGYSANMDQPNLTMKLRFFGTLYGGSNQVFPRGWRLQPGSGGNTTGAVRLRWEVSTQGMMDADTSATTHRTANLLATTAPLYWIDPGHVYREVVKLTLGTPGAGDGLLEVWRQDVTAGDTGFTQVANYSNLATGVIQRRTVVSGTTRSITFSQQPTLYTTADADWLCWCAIGNSASPGGGVVKHEFRKIGSIVNNGNGTWTVTMSAGEASFSGTPAAGDDAGTGRDDLANQWSTGPHYSPAYGGGDSTPPQKDMYLYAGHWLTRAALGAVQTLLHLHDTAAPTGIAAAHVVTTNLPRAGASVQDYGTAAKLMRRSVPAGPEIMLQHTVSATTSPQDNFWGAWVSDALAAQTIPAAAWTWCIKSSEQTGSANVAIGGSLLVIRESSPGSGTWNVVGTVFDAPTPTVPYSREWQPLDGSVAPAQPSGASGTVVGAAVTVQANDRLRWQPVDSHTQTIATAYQARFYYGGTDPVTEYNESSSGDSWLGVAGYQLQFADGTVGNP